MKTAFKLLLVILTILPGSVFAANFTVSPVLIDLDVAPRDVLVKDITLTNNSNSKIYLYATVNEISVEGGQVKEFITPVLSDRENTVTNWLEISRARIELEPGETTTTPLTIRINPYAEPGEYHALIGFVNTSKRPDAEAKALQGLAEGVIVKISIEEKTNELLRISSFLIDRFIFSKDTGNIEIEIQNQGDSPTVPNGEIIFYNSRGEEVSSMPVNAENLSVDGGDKKTITAQIPFDEKIGRYKANLVLRYGKDQQAAVFDTTQFFMVPLPLLIAILVLIVVLSIAVTLVLRKSFYNDVHDDDEGSEVPLYVRNDREHVEIDHDIHITKS